MNLVERLTQRFFQSALLWGGLLSVAFYVLLEMNKGLVDPWLMRSLTGRWEAYLCTSLFFIGVASLAVRMIDVVYQSLALLRPLGEKHSEGEKPAQSAEALLEQLDKDAAASICYLRNRLKNALQFATRNVPSKALIDYLSDLADADRAQMEQKYELTKFLTWALPAVGSLATVLGIASAISQLNATNSTELIAGVTSGLAVAFDTFALALGLSILLVLFKFISRQSEERLLSAVDQRVGAELKTQLDETVDSSSAQIEQLRMLTSSVIKATEKLTQHQNSPEYRNATLAGAGGAHSAEIDEKRMETMVARAMANALQQQSSNAIVPTGGGADLAGWKPLQQALQQVANYLARQQAKQEDEGEVVQQLLNIIDDELKDDQPVRNRPELRMHVGENAAVGLWK